MTEDKIEEVKIGAELEDDAEVDLFDLNAAKKKKKKKKTKKAKTEQAANEGGVEGDDGKHGKFFKTPFG